MNNSLSIQSGSGLAGVWNTPQAAQVLYFLLHSLQHRGSDAAGLAVSDGTSIALHRERGLLSETITGSLLEELPGSQAIGHVRMAGPEDRHKENLQPVGVRAFQGQFAVVCCGMALNGPSLRQAMKEEGLIFQGTSDAELIAHLIQVSEGTLAERIEQTVQILKGSLAFLVMTKNTLYAWRSSDGLRSLFQAFLPEGGVLFASESSAFSMLETSVPEEVRPGELVILGKNGLEHRQVLPGLAHACAMEYVYYSRADSVLSGQSVHLTREACGQLLGQRETCQADMVIGVPDTALVAAAAFAAASGIPCETGLIKNRYIGSTFIRPASVQRAEGMRVRLNAVSSVVKGKSVIVVDDSLQKGLTARRICRLLREAGVGEIHLRIASPLIAWSCYAGTEFIAQEQLAAHLWTPEQMKTVFDADSIAFLPLEDFARLLPDSACLACCSGHYPLHLHDFADAQA